LYRLETRFDFLIMTLICTAVLAMGVLMLAMPTRAVPTERAAYAPVSGVLAAVADRGARRMPRIRFTIIGDDRYFESDAIGFRDGADRWARGRTRLAFLVEPDAPESGDARDPIPAFGIVVDGIALRTFDDDIRARNARAQPWAGMFAVTLGVLGLVTAGFAWRRRPPV
jgi:hypothetical protein